MIICDACKKEIPNGLISKTSVWKTITVCEDPKVSLELKLTSEKTGLHICYNCCKKAVEVNMLNDLGVK